MIVGVAMLLLAGCGSSPVADDLDQREANQIVAVLRDNGIDATTEKGRGAKGRYSVQVASSSFGESVSLLSKLGLPGEKRASFSELMAPHGLLPSSQEVEDLRLDRAMASEVEDLLEGHPAVALASVVVRSHSLPGGGIPSVSIVIQKKRGVDVSPQQIREVVARAVPGVKGEDVLISIGEMATALKAASAGDSEAGLVPFFIFWKVPASEYRGLAFLLFGLFVLASGLAGIGGYIYGQYSLSKGADGALPQPHDGAAAAKARRNAALTGEDEE